MAFKAGDRLTATTLNREFKRVDKPAPWAGPGLLGGEMNGSPYVEKAGNPIIPRRGSGGSTFTIPTVATFGDLAALGLSAPALAYVSGEGVLYNLTSRGWTPASEYLPWDGA